MSKQLAGWFKVNARALFVQPCSPNRCRSCDLQQRGDVTNGSVTFHVGIDADKFHLVLSGIRNRAPQPLEHWSHRT
ncbi:MAG: hypothetical protein K2Q07_02860 [Burkholderiaceae bacterium]|nr:hypothetical protein [Burkholderiaceae bacterium]